MPNLIPYVLNDPRGSETAAAIENGTLLKPELFFLSNFGVGWAMFILITLGCIASIYTIIQIAQKVSKRQEENEIIAASPFILLYLMCGVAFLMTTLHWKVL